MNNRFTPKAEEVLKNALLYAEEYGHTYIGSEHVLIALCISNETAAHQILTKNGVSYEKIDKYVKEYSGIGTKCILTAEDTTPRCKAIIEDAYKTSLKYSAQKIGTEHILLALLDEKDCVANRLIAKTSNSISAIRDECISYLKTVEKELNKNNVTQSTTIPNLIKYGKIMTELAKSGTFDPVIGRESETDRIIRILSRKRKNNPCLIGDAGVGKTAIIEGLSARIASGNVPQSLKNKTIVSVDLTSMVAGAKYRGDFEERIKSIIDEATKNKSIILFIDEIHTIVGAGSAEGAIDASNIMKPALARGDFQLIGATTAEEYRKYIEKDSALERRFQPLLINEPNEEQTIEILRGIRPRYELHHNVIIDDSALTSAIRLSTRYITDRYLPDKAIDLMDEACAKVNLERAEPTGLINFSDNKFKQNAKPIVTAKDIASIVSESTGCCVESSESASASDISSALIKKIIGQDEAISSLASAVKRSTAGINDKARPRGIFLFVGNSGVGKTELSKALAEFLFGSADSLIRYDMSEYSEPGAVSKMLGTSPGYVGYDQKGGAFEKIRKHPYSVILLDEIEKAHSDVLSLFLQVFDTGIITDSLGRKISFRNSYIIMTSNVGSISSSNDIGFMKSGDIKKSDYKLRERFKEEFINRIDKVIPFLSLSENALSNIAKIKLNELSNRLEEKELHLSFDDSACSYFAKKAYALGKGARPIARLITDEAETKIADMILCKEIRSGEKIMLSANDGSLKIEKAALITQ